MPLDVQVRLWRERTDRAEAEFDRLREAILLHHERVKTLGLNSNGEWGGQWDAELWAAVGLPNAPAEVVK